MFNSKLNVIMVYNSECMVIHNSMTRLIGLWTCQTIKFKMVIMKLCMCLLVNLLNFYT